jgi:hypothetical protein
MKTLTQIRFSCWAVLLTLIVTSIGAQSVAQGRPRHSSGLIGQIILHNGLTVNLGRPSASSRPFPASVGVYAAATGDLVVAVTSDRVGRFQVALPPGDYRVVPDTMHHGRVVEPSQVVIGRYEEASPVEVTVRAHGYARLAISYEERMGN